MTTEAECGIECVGLEKVFGKRTVLRDIHFRIEAGRVLALVGSNGAGKTTLLKILSTLIIPSSGRALICGEDVTAAPRQIRKKIGFVSSEERSFYWRLTGRQNLKFFAFLHNMDGKQSESRIDFLLKTIGLDSIGDIPFRECSSGMKQALCIIRGILHDPAVLLLDEPTRSLSPDIALKIRRFIRYEATEKGKSILIATHNLEEAAEIADQIAIIHRGAIRAVGTMSELKALAGLSPSVKLDAIFEFFTLEAGRR